MSGLPWVSITIGAADDEGRINFELNYSTITTPLAMRARRDIGAVMRALEQWDDVLWKLCRRETEAMGDRIAYDEKRRVF